MRSAIHSETFDLATKLQDVLARLQGDQRGLLSLLKLIRMLADPRGRCDRKAFLHIALAFLAAQTGIAALLWSLGVEVDQTATLLMNAPVLWIGTTVCIKRLHDVGRRGWWLPGAVAVWLIAAVVVVMLVAIVLGPEAMAEGEPAFLAMFALVSLPAFGALIWLHMAASVPHANRFGPVPTGFGLSQPPSQRSTSRRTRAARTYYAMSVLA